MNLVKLYKPVTSFSKLKVGDKIMAIEGITNFGRKMIYQHCQSVYTVEQIYKCCSDCKDCPTEKLYIHMLDGEKSICGCHYKLKLLDGRIVK